MPRRAECGGESQMVGESDFTPLPQQRSPCSRSRATASMWLLLACDLPGELEIMTQRFVVVEKNCEFKKFRPRAAPHSSQATKDLYFLP